jgi:hypothetical protein
MPRDHCRKQSAKRSRFEEDQHSGHRFRSVCLDWFITVKWGAAKRKERGCTDRLFIIIDKDEKRDYHEN